ncbi:oxygen-independent coproporphyrinogen III oxidase [Puniceicoccus vermicola]|uniref:Coproporphyrinogen-III oxidase n=1 Tax=Puniceicoccus vermicola TaxID=388746 RepID=A0A7X1AYT4_9BACT|nr:oxygen-independent coproporphyrinogen III oxidase [Puniceicoccus vermicola]MBC2602472.1 oxygen-independent coproporphyrinogen III oxidase [Puniceicoccus vermicola]
MDTVKMDIPSELIAKYNRPGPRYTSYPTAIHFTEEASPENLLASTRESTGPLSLYFHLPFCETLCWFCGCNTIITKDHGRVGDYRKLLEREMDLFGEIIQPGRTAHQLHFGGGTPNFFPADEIARLGESIRNRFSFAEDAECSVELAPAHLSEDQVKAFASFGVKRASFGVQDVDPKVQKAIHRIQPHEMNVRTMDWLRTNGFQSVNVDLIYGLPGQTVDSFRKTLETVLALNPDRFAIFNYAHVPWMKPAQRMLERAGLPTAWEKIEMLRLIVSFLTDHGYRYVGMDHFAKPDDELVRAQEEKSLQRNFQGYSTKAGLEIAAFGISSISQTDDAYRQNTKDLLSYRRSLDEGQLPIEKGCEVTRDDRIRRDAIHRMMCDLEIDRSAFNQAWGIQFDDFFAGGLAGLQELESDGLLEDDGETVAVTETGRLFLRNIAMCFDADREEKEGRYSKTV